VGLVYFDASALVQLLVEEPGSERVAALWDGAGARLTSRLGHVEVCAALAAAGRAGRLDGSDARTALQAWQGFWRAMVVVELTQQVADHAAELAAEHALRGADAIHLASALAVGEVVVAVWDTRLRQAVVAAGLDCVPA
jgi:hypothetical protein